MVNPLYPATNSTGWIELFNGHPISAAWAVYAGSLGAGVIISVLFLVFQALVIMKTRNFSYAFVLGLVFLGVMGGAQYLVGLEGVGPIVNVIFTIMVLELGVMMYYWFFK